MSKPLSGRRVLVVEDEMLVLMSIEDMLSDLGCEQVVAAGTVEKALATIERGTFDAAMVDMNLNGVPSDRVLDALLARDVPFVVSTGYSVEDIGDRNRGRPIIRKPFDSEALAQVLENLLRD